jgi:rhizoxin synthesis polyketide synthase/nonribosomal peptide synthetase RhiB
MQSFMPSAGQSNYAAGCAFKDSFASHLARQGVCAIKVINWGYWGGLGVVASQAYRDRMAKLGMGSIEPDQGMQAVQQLLSGPQDQRAFLKTTLPQIAASLGVSAHERIVQYPASQPSAAAILSAPSTVPMPVDSTQVDGTALQDFDAALSHVLFAQLEALGLFAQSEDSVSARSVLSPLYHRWLAASLRLLARRGYLSCSGDHVRVSDPRPLPAPEILWKRWREQAALWKSHPALGSMVRLVSKTLQSLG